MDDIEHWIGVRMAAGYDEQDFIDLADSVASRASVERVEMRLSAPDANRGAVEENERLRSLAPGSGVRIMELEDEVERLRAEIARRLQRAGVLMSHAGMKRALEKITRIGAAPRDSMTWNRRECERRGQAMLDAANEGLRAAASPPPGGGRHGEYRA